MICKRTIRKTSRQNYNLKLNVPDVLTSWSYIPASIVYTISVSCVTFIFTHKQKISDVDGRISIINRISHHESCYVVVTEVKYLFKYRMVEREEEELVMPKLFYNRDAVKHIGILMKH